ncbi:MAG: SDR family NAD(P)-dependent oxidoreductase [Myxococcota bacterium]|nr:SDR family NAD(P)-dependent oxidoreductase [Myxococcota bacterium]MDW8361468.1 SDR family NAD(P)-dependent oxidoreductase [Myxococcales bacterium]
MSRAAFLTGASSGIGEALARRLARDGWRLGLAARRVERLESLAAELRAGGVEVRVYPLDVRRPDEVREALRRADADFGELDTVVANAGVGESVPASELTFDKIADTLAVNVTGAAATLLAILDRMVARGRGHLVGISSLAQYRGLPRGAAYCGSKAFLSTFLESLRIDLHGTGIDVTDVRPGFVRTPMTARHRHPMPFLVSVEEAAEIVARGVAERRPLVVFPAPLAAAVRIGRLAPEALYRSVVRRMYADRT